MTALNVLVVEDDALIGALLAEMLEDRGYNVCAIAATEEAAVAAAARYKPGLMIVDEQLREGSGGSAMDRILRTGQMPCVFITGAPLWDSPAGAVLLRKPFVEEDLMHAIKHVVGCSGDRQCGDQDTV